MKTRIVTASVLMLFLVILAWINNHTLIYLAIGAMLVVAFLESLKLYGIQNKFLLIVVIFEYAALSYFDSEVPFADAIKISIFTITALASYLAFVKSQNSKIILPFIYPTIPILLMFELYNYYDIAHICWLMLTVAACDSGAYFVGRAFGKHKFSPTSPSKTVEGVIGGLAVAQIFSLFYANIYFVYSFKQIIVMTLILTLFGVFGDLFESWLKRNAGVKDSGCLFPGHGGMLDRIDGYLFGAIALFLVLAW